MGYYSFLCSWTSWLHFISKCAAKMDVNQSLRSDPEAPSWPHDVMGFGHLCPQVRREPRASISTDPRECEHCFQQTRTLMDREIWGESLQLYALEVAFLHPIFIINPMRLSEVRLTFPGADQGQPSCHTTSNLLLSRWPALSWRSPPPFLGSTSNTFKCKQSSCFLKSPHLLVLWFS